MFAVTVERHAIQRKRGDQRAVHRLSLIARINRVNTTNHPHT